MSQAGILDVENSNPQIPTQFDTNLGSAIPIANTLEIVGGAGVTTSGSGNTVTIALTGGGAGIDSITVDAFTAPGTNPVIPDGTGLITVTGSQVASSGVGANVIRSNSLAANSYTMEIQQAGSAALTTPSLNGVAHFNNSHFSVSSGFVSLAGGGMGIDSVAVDAGISPISPTPGGLITINGASVLAGTNPVFTRGTGANTMSVEIQISQAISASDSTKVGLSNFDKVDFTVDTNGFVNSTYTKSFLFGGM